MILVLYLNIKIFAEKLIQKINSFFENLVKIFDSLECLPRNPFRQANLKYRKLVIKYIYEDYLLKNKLILDDKKIQIKKKIFNQYQLNYKKINNHRTY